MNLILNGIEACREQRRRCTWPPSRRPTAPGPSSRSRTTGAGISPAVAPHIFDPFVTTKDTGSGLGLYIAHRIVTEHGGAIHDPLAAQRAARSSRSGSPRSRQHVMSAPAEQRRREPFSRRSAPRRRVRRCRRPGFPRRAVADAALARDAGALAVPVWLEVPVADRTHAARPRAARGQRQRPGPSWPPTGAAARSHDVPPGASRADRRGDPPAVRRADRRSLDRRRIDLGPALRAHGSRPPDGAGAAPRRGPAAHSAAACSPSTTCPRSHATSSPC